MFQSVDFTFDGVPGSNFGLVIARVGESGFLEQPFGIKRKSIIEKPPKKYRAFSYGFESEVLEFDLTLAKKNAWSYEDRTAVSRWLIKNGYKTLTSADYPLEFDVAVVGEPKFYAAGNGCGYVTLTMESDVPFAYSPTSVSRYDLSDNVNGGTIIKSYNNSNIYDIYKPEIQIELKGTETSFKLTNLNDSGRIVEMTGLHTSEVIYMNNEREGIYSDSSNTRLENLTDMRFFREVYGVNNIKCEGKMILTIRNRFPMMI